MKICGHLGSKSEVSDTEVLFCFQSVLIFHLIRARYYFQERLPRNRDAARAGLAFPPSLYNCKKGTEEPVLRSEALYAKRVGVEK